MDGDEGTDDNSESGDISQSLYMYSLLYPVLRSGRALYRLTLKTFLQKRYCWNLKFAKEAEG